MDMGQDIKLNRMIVMQMNGFYEGRKTISMNSEAWSAIQVFSNVFGCC